MEQCVGAARYEYDPQTQKSLLRVSPHHSGTVLQFSSLLWSFSDIAVSSSCAPGGVVWKVLPG